MFLKCSGFPANCAVSRWSLASFIQREDLFLGKLLLDQREFFRTKSDLKISKMEETDPFANFNISMED